MAEGAGRLEGAVHVFPVRVYHEDTDAAGIVYYANYLRFAERARTELLRSLGIRHAELMRRDGVGFAVRDCTIDYVRPAHLDDELEVHTRITGLGAATLRATQDIKRADAELVRMRVRLACLGRTGRPVRLPGAVRTALNPLSTGKRRD